MANPKQTKIEFPVARDENVVVESVGDETVVYDLVAHVAHALKPLAAAVYMYADGTNTAAEIAELASYRLDTVVTEADVADAIVQLEAISLISSPVLHVESGISRRHALKTFAAAGAGSMLVLSVATSAASACTTCSQPPPSTAVCSELGINNPGPNVYGTKGTQNYDCRICNENSQCASGGLCCCTPCGASNSTKDAYCCQPVCLLGNQGTCPTGTWPLGQWIGPSSSGIGCPANTPSVKWARYDTNYGGGVVCCEVGVSPFCPAEKNGVCCAA